VVEFRAAERGHGIRRTGPRSRIAATEKHILWLGATRLRITVIRYPWPHPPTPCGLRRTRPRLRVSAALMGLRPTPFRDLVKMAKLKTRPLGSNPRLTECHSF
jgi:hypothetical protein